MTALSFILIVVVPLSLFAIVATVGTREDGGWQRAGLENAGFIAVFAFVEYFAFGFFQAMGCVFLVAFLIVRCQDRERPALRRGSIDVHGLAGTLAAGATDEGEQAAFHYEHQAEKARVLKSTIDTETAIIEAQLKRDRRRAEVAEAERFLEEARRRSEKGR